MMMKKLFLVLILSTFNNLMGFTTMYNYAPIRIFVKGKIINLKTGKPIKKKIVYIGDERMDEVNFQFDEALIDAGKTNCKGNFFISSFIDKNNLQFWLKTKEFAPLNIFTPNLNTTQLSDTIDLGIIYFVPYDNELEVTSFNIPKSRKKRKGKYKKYTIRQVDSIFKLSTHTYDMQLNPIDTIISMSRYNFGSNKPRGTTIKHFKQLTFKKKIN